MKSEKGWNSYLVQNVWRVTNDGLAIAIVDQVRIYFYLERLRVLFTGYWSELNTYTYHAAMILLVSFLEVARRPKAFELNDAYTSKPLLVLEAHKVRHIRLLYKLCTFRHNFAANARR